MDYLFDVLKSIGKKAIPVVFSTGIPWVLKRIISPIELNVFCQNDKDEAYIKKLLKWCCLWGIGYLVLYFFAPLYNIINTIGSAISGRVSQEKMLGASLLNDVQITAYASLVIVFFMLSYYAAVLVYGSVKKIDEKIANGTIEFGGWKRGYITLIVWAILTLGVCVICKDEQSILLAIYAVAMLISVRSLAYNIFLYLYVRLRKAYVRDGYVFKTKSSNKEIKIQKFREKDEKIIYREENGSRLEKITLPISNICEWREVALKDETELIQWKRRQEKKEEYQIIRKGRILELLLRKHKGIVLTQIYTLAFILICIIYKTDMMLNVKVMFYPYLNFAFYIAVLLFVFFLMIEVVEFARKVKDSSKAKGIVKDQLIVEIKQMMNKMEKLNEGAKNGNILKKSILKESEHLMIEISEFKNEYSSVSSESLKTGLQTIYEICSIICDANLSNEQLDDLLFDFYHEQKIEKIISTIEVNNR